MEGLLVILCIYLFAFTTAVTNSNDVAALKSLYSSLRDPSGKLSSWKQGDPCDDKWNGVICQKTDGNKQSITELHLMQNNLSGTISPEIKALRNLRVLNLMWNQITGSIPAGIGDLVYIELLLLNGNKLTGTLPPELGKLKNMNRIQIDENQITGNIPPTFGDLMYLKHLHANNNSLNGSIPPELGRLPKLFHILVDNNKMAGDLPEELANISTLQILQVDNNDLGGAQIPAAYSNMTKLLKLSMRNCNLKGELPDFSKMMKLEYLDLSNNLLTGALPTALLNNLTTVNLANNLFGGQIPSSLAQQQNLQVLLLQNNKLNGSVPVEFVKRNNQPVLDLQNNSLSDFSSDFNGQADSNVSLRLYGNVEICKNYTQFCTPQNFDVQSLDKVIEDKVINCEPQICDPTVSEFIPALASEGICRCASPIQVLCRLKSPGFTLFYPIKKDFQDYMAKELMVSSKQVHIALAVWEPGPRLYLNLKIFPLLINDTTRKMNTSEVQRIFEEFARWKIRDNPQFGPRELIEFRTPYGEELFGGGSNEEHKSLTKGQLAAIIIAVIFGTAAIVALGVFRFTRRPSREHRLQSMLLSKAASSVKIDNVRAFTFQELSNATESFSETRQIGKGGYGKVYRGILEDGQVVAIKRADEESHQGVMEFFNEIELLSRIHHRNLVSLVGFCIDRHEQMLVYEFIGGGTLSERLISRPPLNFKRRVYIALGAARGILYLHTEANPPIIHRDIKGTNILIGEKDNAKVADFGLSKLAPEEDDEGFFGHVSTVVKGTPGYLDPEYFLTRKLSDKSDIYSFGVVMLELVTGMQAISHGKNLVREVRSAYEEGASLSIVDPLMGAYPSEALGPFVRLALSCCLDTPEGRPNIRTVVRDLEDIWKRMSSWDYTDVEATDVSGVLSSNATSSAATSSYVLSSHNIGPVIPR